MTHAVDPDARADLYGHSRERPVTEVLVDLVRIDAGAPVVHLDDIGPTVLVVVQYQSIFAHIFVEAV